jgi:hypothetical protein
MNPRLRSRPSVEPLEDRSVPSVSATITGGTLLVTGEASIKGDPIAITQTSPGVFAVVDGATPVTIDGAESVSNVVVRLGHASDTVNINLGDSPLAGSVAVRLGGGTNSLTVASGTINGNLDVTGGPGDDSVTVADGMTVNGALTVGTGGGDDVVMVGKATLGSATFDLDVGNDLLTFDAVVGSGAGRVLDVATGSGNDTVVLGSSSAIQGDAVADLGNGNDTFTFDAATLTGTLLARGEQGKDTFNGTAPRDNVTAIGFES